MTEHKAITEKKFLVLQQKTRVITADETDALVAHLRYSGQHPWFFNSSAFNDANLPAALRAHQAAVLRGEIKVEDIDPRIKR